VETSLSRPPASFDLLRSTHLDETRALVAGVFCDHQLDLVQREPLDYVHLHGQIGRIGFSVMSYGAEVQITPGPLKSFFLVQMPLEGHDLIRIGKESLHSDANHASVHSPDDSLGMQWSKDCRKMVVRFDREALERHAQSMTGTPVRPGGLKFQPVMDARQGGTGLDPHRPPCPRRAAGLAGPARLAADLRPVRAAHDDHPAGMAARQRQRVAAA
jgi:hypothetical protein